MESDERRARLAVEKQKSVPDHRSLVVMAVGQQEASTPRHQTNARPTIIHPRQKLQLNTHMNMITCAPTPLLLLLN